MNLTPSAGQQQSLEQFRQLLFHLQMQCGSIHHIFRFFKEQESMRHFETLKAIDPNLMSQLLAREYVLEARKSPNPKNARSHLETALQLDPECPEAFLEMASISNTPEAAMKWYSQCMQYTMEQLGSERFNALMDEFKEQPWHQVELHTYLKAKVSLAEKLFQEGYYEVATLHFKDMMEWNPTDDIFIRHFLMIALLCENRLDEAQVLKMEFPSDLTAQWYYSKAFLQYKLEGGSRRSNRLLMRAFKRNLWAAVYVLGLKEMPDLEQQHDAVDNPFFLLQNNGDSFLSPNTPNAFKEGSHEEAVDCVRCIAPVILEDAKLAAWVWEMLKGLV